MEARSSAFLQGWKSNDVWRMDPNMMGGVLWISIQVGVAGQHHAAPFLFLLRLKSIRIPRAFGARVLNIGATRS